MSEESWWKNLLPVRKNSQCLECRLLGISNLESLYTCPPIYNSPLAYGMVNTGPRFCQSLQYNETKCIFPGQHDFDFRFNGPCTISSAPSGNLYSGLSGLWLPCVIEINQLSLCIMISAIKAQCRFTLCILPIWSELLCCLIFTVNS